jgi:prevent-host-death family protein
MKTITATVARRNLYGLIADVNDSSEPVTITGSKGNGVLLSEDDYRAIEETLYLLTAGMGKTIRDGLKIPLEECSDADLEW